MSCSNYFIDDIILDNSMQSIDNEIETLKLRNADFGYELNRAK